MSSLFTSFNAGVSGLQSAQSGLNTTAHNIANVNTEGYTRQQDILTDTYYQTLSTTSYAMLQVGSGVTVATIRQIRDTYLDSEYRYEVGIQSFYEVQYTAATEVEDILGELNGTEFDDELTALWTSIQNLSTNPESVTNRQLFISQCVTFLEVAQNIYDELRNYQVSLNSQIQSTVNRINEIADEISNLNQQIAKIEASGLENANDLRDARNLLLDELAVYTAYDAYEQADGRVVVRINNAPLVDEGTSYHMETEYIEGTSMFTVVWADSGYGEVYHIDEAFTSANNSDSGSLLSLMVASGERYGYYTDIPQDIDELTGQSKTDALSAYNSTIGNCLIERVEAQLDLLVNYVVEMINDVFAPNIEADLTDITDESGSAISDLSGVTVTLSDGTESTLAEVLADQGITDLSSVRILDVINCPVGADDDETIGTEVFSRKNTDRYEVYTLSEQIYSADDTPLAQEVKNADGSTSYLLYVYNEENADDVDSLYTLQNLEINEKLLQDYSYLAVMGNPELGASGTYDYSIYQDLLDGWRAETLTLDPNSMSKYAVDGFYDALVGSLATQGSVWKSIMENQEVLVQSIDNQRMQISGVSTSEEMVNLLMYQHMYNASSRYITVIDNMLEYLINRLG